VVVFFFWSPHVASQFQIFFHVQQNKQGLLQEKEAENSANPSELDFRKPLLLSILQISEELRLYNLLKNLTISNRSLKAISSFASLG
jgi:hypothetical protein